jgi:hypothetical protein
MYWCICCDGDDSQWNGVISPDRFGNLMGDWIEKTTRGLTDMLQKPVVWREMVMY